MANQQMTIGIAEYVPGNCYLPITVGKKQEDSKYLK
jgi:hypothetical protein